MFLPSTQRMYFEYSALHVSTTKGHLQVLQTTYTYWLIHGAEPFLRRRQLCSHSRTSQHFMEPEGSVPCSQEPPSIGPYSEPYQSNPYHPILFRSILILSTHLRLGVPSGLFPSGFPTNKLHTFLFSPIRATCPAHLITNYVYNY
jgi:hypothetical protein